MCQDTAVRSGWRAAWANLELPACLGLRTGRRVADYGIVAAGQDLPYGLSAAGGSGGRVARSRPRLASISRAKLGSGTSVSRNAVLTVLWAS